MLNYDYENHSEMLRIVEARSVSGLCSGLFNRAQARPSRLATPPDPWHIPGVLRQRPLDLTYLQGLNSRVGGISRLRRAEGTTVTTPRAQ